MTESKFKKVALIGSAGVGKTTLLEALFKEDSIANLYNKIPEQVRVLCNERGYKNPYEIDGDVHQFREDVLLRQIQAEKQFTSFIADRSTIDAWVYFMRWSWNSADVDTSERFYQAAHQQAQNYDLLVYLPIMFEISDDKFRWANATYQRQIDRLLLAMVDSWGLRSKLYELKSLSIEGRVDELSRVINPES